MKNLIVLIAAVSMIGCGGGSSGSKSSGGDTPAATPTSQCGYVSSLVFGLWEEVTTGQLISLNSNCGFAENACLWSGTFYVAQDNVVTLFDGPEDADPGCDEPAELDCGFIFDEVNDRLGLACPNNTGGTDYTTFRRIE